MVAKQSDVGTPNGTPSGSAARSDALKESMLLSMDRINADQKLNASRVHINTKGQAWEDFYNSIKDGGLDHPVDVRKLPTGGKYEYELVNGFRRFTAAKAIGWSHIPARVIEAESRFDAMLRNIVDNIEREGLSPAEELHSIVQLREQAKTEGKKVSGAELGNTIKRSKAHVNNMLRVHDNLIAEWKKALTAGEISMDRAIALSAMTTDAQRKALPGSVGEGGEEGSGEEGNGEAGEDETPAKPKTLSRRGIEALLDRLPSALTVKVKKGGTGKAEARKPTQGEIDMVAAALGYILNPKTKTGKDRNPFEYPAEEAAEESDDDE